MGQPNLGTNVPEVPNQLGTLGALNIFPYSSYFNLILKNSPSKNNVRNYFIKNFQIFINGDDVQPTCDIFRRDNR